MKLPHRTVIDFGVIDGGFGEICCFRQYVSEIANPLSFRCFRIVLIVVMDVLVYAVVLGTRLSYTVVRYSNKGAQK